MSLFTKRRKVVRQKQEADRKRWPRRLRQPVHVHPQSGPRTAADRSRRPAARDGAPGRAARSCRVGRVGLV